MSKQEENNENLVTVTRHQECGVITIDNPPVNALSFDLRKAFLGALETLRDDISVKGIAIMCAGRTFVAGADIKEFGKPPQTPTLRDIIVALEQIEKPTVAVLHGTALGGGLELALGCHFRIALESARLGLPEIKLGLIPGAGGTVRLPRLTGSQKALEMICSGAQMDAAEAQQGSVVDLVFDGDMEVTACAFLREKIVSDAPLQPVRERELHLGDDDREAFEKAITAIEKKARGLEAPVTCAALMRDALELDFEEALIRERALFERLMAGDQSKAQRHLFFAERTASKIADIDKNQPKRTIRSIGVIGAGTMGGGIAMSFANAGLPVTILEVNEETLEAGRERITRNYDFSVTRGSLTEEKKTERLGCLSFTTDYADLKECDLIIEAAFEKMAVKKEIFSTLDTVAKPEAILATNTSYLDVNEIAQVTSRPSDVLGMHFFSPANIMKLLEIVRGEKTAPDVLASVISLSKQIGKVPVIVGVCHGFAGNRMLAARGVDVEELLLEGGTPWQVDKVFRDFGWPMGPYQMRDLAGIDIGWLNRQALGETAPIQDHLYEQGRLGQKTGKGYYLYEDGSRESRPDPEVEDLICEKSSALNIERRAIDESEIIERTLYPMINEGALILDEGIAARASDLDVVWVNGFGFPTGKGGPMFWARNHGFGMIIDRLTYWYEKTGKKAYKPSQHLHEMATGSAE
jgi:3-hydroxyacyl-CoA dehydrogenase